MKIVLVDHGRWRERKRAMAGDDYQARTKAAIESAPTLMPSLGCPRWRAGTCIGHWWLRDGELVLA